MTKTEIKQDICKTLIKDLRGIGVKIHKHKGDTRQALAQKHFNGSWVLIEVFTNRVNVIIGVEKIKGYTAKMIGKTWKFEDDYINAREVSDFYNTVVKRYTELLDLFKKGNK